jgi:hypothetical protein
MSKRTFLVTLLALAMLVIPLSAHGASIRVAAAGSPYLGNLEWESGSARTYLAADGTAHILKPNTALGQLVAATAFTDTRLVITQFSFGPFVSAIGTRGGKPSEGWLYFVNGRPAQVGAADLNLRTRDRVLWLFDPDTQKKGPYVLDVRVAVRTNGTVVATVRKVGGKKPVAARGASIYIDGRLVGKTNAAGRYIHRLPVDTATGSFADWGILQAKMKGVIPSQLVQG